MVERAAVGPMAGEAARPVEHGEGAVRVLVDPHLQLDEVRPDRDRMPVFYIEGVFSTRHHKVFRVEAQHSDEALDKVTKASDSDTFWAGAACDHEVNDASFCVVEEPADAEHIDELSDHLRAEVTGSVF